MNRIMTYLIFLPAIMAAWCLPVSAGTVFPGDTLSMHGNAVADTSAAEVLADSLTVPVYWRDSLVLLRQDPAGVVVVPDGFSLTTLQPLYVSASEDSDVDIYVPAGQDSDVMSDGWLSKSGLKFARMDGIDYPTITRNRLWTLYSNAVKTDAVNGIAVGDVIMVGTDAVALGIILVTGVFDEEGTESDRYMFNIKLM